MLQIKNIVDAVVKEYYNQVRVGFVGYRDYCDDGDRIMSIGITENISEVS